jgi:hypothetical protein
MFWVDKWMLLFLEYCYDIETNIDNDYGQFVELDLLE